MKSHPEELDEPITATDEAWEAFARKFEATRFILRSKAKEIAERRAVLNEQQAEPCAKHGGEGLKGTDKLKLNVGGTRVTATRGTLTLFPGTLLAAMFSGRWESRLLRDKKKRIFLDVDPKCFMKILVGNWTSRASSPT